MSCFGPLTRFWGKFGSKVKLSKFYHGVKRLQNETAVKKKKMVQSDYLKNLKDYFYFKLKLLGDI